MAGVPAALATNATAAGWTTPSVLTDGDTAGIFTLTLRADDSLRAAVADTHTGVALGLADLADGGRAFSSPVPVLRRPASATEVAFAADGSGLAAQASAGRGQRPSVVPFDAAGTPQPPVVLDTAIGTPTVGVAPDGAAVVAWVAKGHDGYEVDAAFREPGAATFGAPTRAGYSGTGDTLLHAGISDRGEAVVVWQVNGFPSSVAAAVRPAGQGFTRARFVTRAATDADLAVGAGGQAVIATSVGHRLDVSVKAPGATTMPKVRTLDRARDEGGALDVTAAGERQLGIAWVAYGGHHGSASRARVYVGGAGPGGLRRIGTVGAHAEGEDVRIAVSPAGATVVGWEESLNPKHGDPTARGHFGVAYRPAGGRLGPPTWMGPVSLDDTPKAVAIGPGGRAAAAYEAFQSDDDGSGHGYRRVYVAERRP